MKIIVTGGCGYVGSALVPKLLRDGHDVEVVDVQWFGNSLAEHERLIVHKEDFTRFCPPGEVLIHLAAIANDQTALLDPLMTWQTNAFGTMNLADHAYLASFKRMIYASSGSVYGINNAGDVIEESVCVPVSAYNETKKVAERCLLSGKLAVQILRPATVCGVSPRMRLDVAVNALAIQAVTRGVIEVHGGQQYRPNIHIEDMTDLYVFMLDHPELTGIWNAGFENLKLIDIAEKIANRTKAEIRIVGENDPRSYRMNSDKLLATGFKPKRTVGMAIAEIEIAVRNGLLKDEPIHYNLKTMKALGL